VFTNHLRKTLGLLWIILLSSVKPAYSAKIEFSPGAELLNNFSQLQITLNNELASNNLKYKISLNELNEKIKIENCGEAQWQIPQGTQLRGRAALVAKCRINGETALFYQSVDVRIHATMVVMAKPLKFNEQADADAFRIEERDITYLQPGELVSRADELIGMQSRRGLAAGLIVKKDMFEVQPAIRAGDNVKVFINGQGFRLSTEAVALQAAHTGQQIRVKTVQGKILTGAVSAQQTVELRL
jgi:flagella basal body P-ring formation protein FlgA